MGDVKLNYERGGCRGRIIHVAEIPLLLPPCLSLSPLLPVELFTFLHRSKAPHPKSTSSFLNVSPHPYPPTVFLFLLLVLVMATVHHPSPSPPRTLHPFFVSPTISYTSTLNLSFPSKYNVSLYCTSHYPFLAKCVISSIPFLPMSPLPHVPRQLDVRPASIFPAVP